jgi:hypothetical protein
MALQQARWHVLVTEISEYISMHMDKKKSLSAVGFMGAPICNTISCTKHTIKCNNQIMPKVWIGQF